MKHLKTNLKSLTQLLTDTKREKYIDDEVLATAPDFKRTDLKIEFFKLTKYVSNEELQKEYDTRGLIPADIRSLAGVKEEVLDDMKYVATAWKDASGNWCYSAFRRWRDERHVDVYRNGIDWHDGWWFAGVRKSDLGISDPQPSLEPLSLADLEKRVKKLESLVNPRLLN